jgi:hypothetical protein
VPLNPDRDENVILHLISKSADGTPSVSNLEDAVQVTLLFRRETGAPVIGVVEATPERVRIGITGFTRFARLRRVRIYSDEALTTLVTTLLFESEDYAARELPRYLDLSRFLASTVTTQGEAAITTEGGEELVTEEEGAVLPATVWVTVAHSGGNGWTPESNVLKVTFAGGGGTGGSEGGFDPTPVDRYRFDMGEV